jgi:hypothetical protein
MKVIHDYAGGNNSLNSPHIDFEGRVGIELRGYTSLNFPKKQYGVELRDQNDQDIAASLLQMPAESDWVLNGPYPDKTLMRNAMAYWVSSEIFGRYAPRTWFVELFLNETGTEHALETYLGVYVLTEKVKRDNNRVDVSALDPAATTEPDITGGYILEITTVERIKPTDSYFLTQRDTLLAHVYPKGNVLSAAQKAWIEAYINDFETVLYGPDFTNSSVGYPKYTDVSTFIDYILIFDLFKNPEAFHASGFMYKDRDKKLCMGPVWDFDIAMGNYYKFGFPDPEGWFIMAKRWAGRLLEDPSFRAQYIARWYELRATTLSIPAILAKIDEWAALLAEAQERNFDRWPILGTYVWPNPGPPFPDTYEEEVAALKSWIEHRILWLDDNIADLIYWQP